MRIAVRLIKGHIDITPPKFAQYHLYRKGHQGAVFFCHMNEVRCEVFPVIYKRD